MVAMQVRNFIDMSMNVTSERYNVTKYI